jgi:hypothetical protein
VLVLIGSLYSKYRTLREDQKSIMFLRCVVLMYCVRTSIGLCGRIRCLVIVVGFFTSFVSIIKYSTLRENRL